MSGWTQEDIDRLNAKRGASLPAHVPVKAQPKYRNVKTMIGSEKFDSKAEADYWQQCKLREKAGLITDLQRQVHFPLYAARYDIQTDTHHAVLVAEYVADVVYRDVPSKQLHIVDVKGAKETQMFQLKRKWLSLQAGIEIEIVR